MLHVGLDLSRKRLDFHALAQDGNIVEVGASPPDRDGLVGLARRLDHHGEPICAAIESMNGARFVHDQLEMAGWEVEIADAQKVKGIAPLACKTDRIDAWVLAELSRRDLVPAIWLPDPEVRAERERARFRLHLVKHRSSLKHRVHSVLLAWGKPCPVSDLFGRRGRELLATLNVPEPWRSHVETAVGMIDDLEREIVGIERELRRSSKRGPRYLRWALLEAATHACAHPVYRERYRRNKRRLGKQRGAKVAQVDIARKLAEAIWHMLTLNQPFAPAGAPQRLAA